MKTRIISGLVMGVIVAAVLALGYFVNSVIVTIAIAAISVIAIYELLHNAAGITNKVCLAGAGVFSVLNILARDYYVQRFLRVEFADTGSNKLFGYFSSVTSDVIEQRMWMNNYKETVIPLIAVIYFFFAVIMILKNHKDFGLPRIVTFSAMPIVLSYAFSSLNSIITEQGIIYYLLMLLNFSSICDMGAYFVGVTCGKHKLCPNISPKKTVEGAIGGIVSSLVFTVVFAFAFGMTAKLVTSLIFTVPLCIVGMMGDLFASSIKRSVNLKDYGSLIPGHGGILDRMDSILMIAPLLYLCMEIGVI